MNRLSTGIPSLDRRLDGGLNPGSVLAIIASPASQSEALIHELMQERPTLYVSTLRRPAAIEDAIPADVERKQDVHVEYAGERPSMDDEFMRQITGNRIHSVANGSSGGASVENVYEVIGKVTDQANVVLDPTNTLERSGEADAYREMLNRLKSTMLETNGLGVLHAIAQDDVPALRETTLLVADVVWELELVSMINGLEYQLVVPKNRGHTPILEEISLKIDPEVWIDDSRNI